MLLRTLFLTSFVALIAVTQTAFAQNQPFSQNQQGFGGGYGPNPSGGFYNDPPVMICSSIAPNTWRDTMRVPYTWRPRDCREFAGSIGAQYFQLGCVFTYGDRPFVWGQAVKLDARASRAAIPQANCGWQFRRRLQ